MEFATAQLNTYRQAPRKVRLLADLVRGKTTAQAILALKFADKRAAGPVLTLLESAIANAKNKGMNADALIVDRVTVNGGATLYRRLPMSRGRAFTKRKRTSHIFVSVSEKGSVAKADAVEKADKEPKAPKAEKTVKKAKASKTTK
jgi:large subunit ribosomal protein L22